MQTVPAAAGDGIIKRKVQIVVAKEPVECRPGCAAPAAVTGYAIGFETRRNCAGSFNRLLIETGLFPALVIKALRSDRHKVPVGFATLRFHQPFQSFETGGDHTIIRAS